MILIEVRNSFGEIVLVKHFWKLLVVAHTLLKIFFILFRFSYQQLKEYETKIIKRTLLMFK